MGMSAHLVIAIDGPSSSGKSTVSRAVAQELGYSYLDTGAMYRAITWFALENSVDLDDPEQIAACAAVVELSESTQPDEPGITVGGTDVSVAIRSAEVTSAVSRVAAVQQVRDLMVARQRTIAADSTNGIVIEGRDIGNVVLPDADLKVFLTADQEARALRRALELGKDPQEVEQSLARRDAADTSRAASPLVMADDAIEVDTTHLELHEVITHILDLVRTRS